MDTIPSHSEGYMGRTIIFRDSVPSTSRAENVRNAAWDSLPEELVARILALLPFSSIFLARAVCKRWRATVWSPLFIKFCKQQPLRLPWLLEFQQYMFNQVWAYDLAASQWFHVNFAYLPENASVVATAGGLICLGHATQDEYSFFLCNPMTKLWRRLPAIPVQPGLVLMSVSPESNSYKVVALVLRGQLGASNTRPNGSVFMYDSKIHGWKETNGMPREMHALSLWDAAICDGVLYCLTTERGGMLQEIKAYDLDQGIWSPFIMDGPNQAIHAAPQLPQHVCEHGLRHNCLLNPQVLLQYQDNQAAGHPNQIMPSSMLNSYILERHGQLLMVTKRQESKVVIHEFDVITRSWKRVDYSMEGIICASRFSSVWFQTPNCSDKLYLARLGKNKGDITALRPWHRLPKSPLTRNKMHGGEIVVKGIWFAPRVDATI